MNVQCSTCKRIFDDEIFTYLCPHHPPVEMPGASYCRRHDLFDCPYCPPMTWRVKKVKDHYELWEMHSETAVDSNVRISFKTAQEVADFIEKNLWDKVIHWNLQ